MLVDCSVASNSHLTATGTCILVEGELKQPPEGTKQRVELMVDKILEVGNVEPKYPIAKSKLSMEHLRASGMLQYVFLHLINHQSQQVCNPSSLTFTWGYPFLAQKCG